MSSSPVVTVAIDGPAASGKSTVSRLVAERLGFCYVDSGAMYRGITWKALREGLDIGRPEAVIELTTRIQLEFFLKSGVVLFAMDGEEPGEQLRSEPVRDRVSDVAAIPEVRAYIVRHLRETTRFGNIVMEGRDIGTVVFPDSAFKFYLDADPQERARRRHLELAEKEGSSDVHKVLDSLQTRDRKDATRKTAPLQIALGARVIDSTAMRIEDVVDLIVAQVRRVAPGHE
jgi:cytidylate kinase